MDAANEEQLSEQQKSDQMDTEQTDTQLQEQETAVEKVEQPANLKPKELAEKLTVLAKDDKATADESKTVSGMT